MKQSGVEEDDFIWGGTKEIADRLRGHGKGEGAGVGFSPSHVKRGSKNYLFQTLIKGAPDPVAREVFCALVRFCKNQLIVCHNRTVSTKN